MINTKTCLNAKTYQTSGYPLSAYTHALTVFWVIMCHEMLVAVSMVNLAKQCRLGFPNGWENQTYMFHRFQQLGHDFTMVFAREEIRTQPMGMMSSNQLHHMALWFCPKIGYPQNPYGLHDLSYSIHMQCAIWGYTVHCTPRYHHVETHRHIILLSISP